MPVLLPKFRIRDFFAITTRLIKGDHDFIQWTDSSVDKDTNHTMEPGVVGFCERANPLTIRTAKSVIIITRIGLDIPFVYSGIIGDRISLPGTRSLGNGVAWTMFGT